MHNSNRNTSCTLLALAVLAGACSAQTVVIPPANENTVGTSTVITMFSNAARSFQWVIPGADLGAAAPSGVIEGFRARTRNAGTVPSSTQNFANYDVYVAELAVPLGQALNVDFTQNIVPGTELQVRSGPLSIQAGAFPTGGNPNAWGSLIEFNLGSYPFEQAKNYIITVRHDGSGSQSPGMDANGNAGNYRGQFTTSYTGTVATSTANYTIVQLQLAEGGQGCYANCDGSTVEPILNIDDFTCFINEFATGQSLPPQQQVTHYANCDGSTVEPVLNIDDFTCFINSFAQGCP